jgi:hypothetical protein
LKDVEADREGTFLLSLLQTLDSFFRLCNTLNL